MGKNHYRLLTILVSASLSDAVDITLTGGVLNAIMMPASWDTANLTFSTSVDGTTYGDFYEDTGLEYIVTAAAARFILLQPDDFSGIRYLKVRSGTSASPVVQTAQRSLTLVFRQP